MPDVAGARLAGGNIVFRIVRPGVDVQVTLQVFVEDGVTVLGLRHIDGKISLSRRERLAVFREELGKIERLAAASGVGEIRHTGGIMTHFFEGYEPFPALRNGVRKRL